MAAVIPMPFGKAIPGAVAQELLESCAKKTGVEIPGVIASFINWACQQKGPLARLLQFCIDTASDEFVAEEFYQKYPELLTFLAQAGSGHEEVRFRAYVHHHPDIFVCKACGGRISGGCPIMVCEACDKLYFVEIADITPTMCERCSASKIGECTLEKRTKRHRIFAV